MVLSVSGAHAAVINVPADQPTVQAGLNAAQPGDRIVVAAGVYAEKITFPRDGTATQPIVLEAAPGGRPVLDGTGLGGCDMVLIDTRSWVSITGFEIRNNLGVSDCSGVRVLGHGDGVEISDNVIHDIRGTDAMGITVYGTDPQAITGLVIDGNVIHDCEPSQSEALVLNGNIDGFAVTNNEVRDVNNIGIDFIGGETSIQPDPNLVARNGICRGNTVIRANSNYGGGFAGGIYVDGGLDIVIENNVVTGCDLGIEVGAENVGLLTTRITVRNNVIYGNEKVGLIFGGYDVSVGRASDNDFLGNTLWGNDTLQQGMGEVFVQWGDDNRVVGNIVAAGGQGLLLYAESGNTGNVLDYNVWFATGSTSEFTWEGTTYASFGLYQSGTGQDGSSTFADPQLQNPAAADFHVPSSSPAVDAGDPGYQAAPGETDLDGQARIFGGRVDVGADELSPAIDDNHVIGHGLNFGPNNTNRVQIFAADGTAAPVGAWEAYGAAAWGTNVGAGDFGPTADSILTGPGPGDVYGPQVRGWSASGSSLARINFYAYGTLKFGVDAAGVDVDGDGYSEILAMPGPGAVFGPHVRGFNYDGGSISPLARVNFFAYSTLKWGVNVSGGDIEPDGYEELFTGPGPGAVFGPHVRGFDVDGGAVASIARINFNAFTLTTFGVDVLGADPNGDGSADVIATATRPHSGLVRGFDVTGAPRLLPGLDLNLGGGAGAEAGAGDFDLDGKEDLALGAAAGVVSAYGYDGSGVTLLWSFSPFPVAAGPHQLAGAALGY